MESYSRQHAPTTPRLVPRGDGLGKWFDEAFAARSQDQWHCLSLLFLPHNNSLIGNLISDAIRVDNSKMCVKKLAFECLLEPSSTTSVLTRVCRSR